MKPNAQSKTKKDELKTYRELGLSRTHKSPYYKNKLIRRGITRVIGGERPDAPPITVKEREYRKVRMEVTLDLMKSAQRAGVDSLPERWLESQQEKIERLTYQSLLSSSSQIDKVSAVFKEIESRSLSLQEKNDWKKLLKEEEKNHLEHSSQKTYKEHYEKTLDGLLRKIQKKQKYNPDRLQDAWISAVGSELAEQTHLERVDNGTAYFRSLNSGVSYHLQRMPELPRKLGRILGVPIERLKSS